MSETSACWLTWTPPSSVLMSTCLSRPFASFCTFTLHAGKKRSAAKLLAAITPEASLFLRMLSSSTGDLYRTLKTSAPRGHIGDADGKVPPNRNFPEQGLDRGYFRNACVGECTQVILDFRKVGRKVRIPHGYDRSSVRVVIQYLLQQCSSRVRHGNGGSDRKS